ncbi:ATP-binding cassette domain-containing protein [Mycoplasmopsis cricetuli]|uniref:ATP-binding cassette domain-containing protein n=1 Tax=Mycoplasmopsis cricetuli TaxID=171283 RepID=UPI00046FE90B|nr:ATP-binding cassette domain-containing protein [Mycoplasmopsis cricetuli]
MNIFKKLKHKLKVFLAKNDPEYLEVLRQYRQEYKEKDHNKIPAIELKNLNIDFGETLAVDNASFQIPEGKLVTLLGPSGSGKTTTLNAIAGLLTATSGKILFKGRDVTNFTPQKSKIGFVFQNYALYPHMSVYANIAFPLKNDLEWQKKVSLEREKAKNNIRMLYLKKIGATEEELALLKNKFINWEIADFESNSRLTQSYAKLIEEYEKANTEYKIALVHETSEISALAKNTLKANKKIKKEINLEIEKLKEKHKKDLKNNLIDESTLQNSEVLANLDTSLLKYLKFNSNEEINSHIEKLKQLNQQLASENFAILEFKDQIKNLKTKQKILMLIARYDYAVKLDEIVNKYKTIKTEKAENNKISKKNFKEIIKNDLEYNVLLELSKNLKYFAEKDFYETVKILEKKYNYASFLKDEKNAEDSIWNQEEQKLLSEYKEKIIPLKKAIHNAVMEVAERVEIVKILQKKPTRLSGGQQQRVSIARAIVKKPQILLMDEPLSNLDAKLRVSTRQWIRKIQQSLGITTVFVTHDQEEAMSISDIIVCMSTARVQQIGTPLELYNKPKNEFVARFLGVPEMSLFSSEFREGSLFVKGHKIENIKLVDKDFAKVKVGIRSEDFIIKENKDEHSFSGTILALENFGKESKLVVEMPDLTRINFLVDNTKQYNVGNLIYFELPVNKLHIFDALTEERIDYEVI